ncbi:hypothetical protein [Lutibaculum baratangense]|nr:hypothetical protein [Lutibaculum baratangense]
MRIKFRCLPGYRGHVPEPRRASEALPDWVRKMPAAATSPTRGGIDVPTVKRCPPFLDAVREGIVFPLVTDLHVRGGEISWDWDLPEVEGRLTIESPIGVHAPEQLTGAPFRVDREQFAIKFSNFWAIEAPAGVSLLFSHPFNREDLPFRTLTGLVDVDAFTRGFVNFPALWVDPGFEGTLPKGTPVAQAVPIRREALELEFDVGEFDEAGFAEQRAFQTALSEDPSVYRKAYRQKRDGRGRDEASDL